MSILEDLFSILKGANPDAPDEALKAQAAQLSQHPDATATMQPLSTPPNMALENKPIPPSSFDVGTSDNTVTQNGATPAMSAPVPPTTLQPQPPEPPQEMTAPVTSPAAPVTPPVSAKPVSSAPTKPVVAPEVLPPSVNDDERRLAARKEADKRQKLSMIPAGIAGVGDAIAAGASSFGVTAPTDKQDKLMARAKANHDESGKLLESDLRNDAKSDISKQYQALLAEFMQKDMKDPLILGMTANQIAEKIPAVENLVKLRQTEELKRAEIAAMKSKNDGKAAEQTTAQKAVDRQFGKDYAQYVAGGGYADTMTQLGTLEGALSDLTKKGGSNISGSGLSMLPDSIRKRTFPDSVATQQAIEQSIQRTLKSTLGGQFTEREGQLFMQRGFDPALDEKQNAKKLERTIGQLKLMALAKQDAVDYYEEHNTLDGFKGTFYTLQNGDMKKASKDDFLSMMKSSPEESRPKDTATADPALEDKKAALRQKLGI